jgi:hypothetical protein
MLKIDLTQATTTERKLVQTKAFELGYGWISGTFKQHRNLKENFMFLDDMPLGKGAKVLTCCNDQKTYKECTSKEISHRDFIKQTK